MLKQRPISISSAIATGTSALQAHSLTPRLDAELLLAHVIGEARAFLYGHPETEIPVAEYSCYRRAVIRRQHGEPAAYLIGRSEFWSLPLRVTSDCLVPRPETELLVERALEHLPVGERGRVLDLGTGSGAIALAIATEYPRCRITAVDSSPAALEIARANAVDLGLTHVEFLLGDWFEAVTGRRFDLILSNPPYLAANDPHLADDGVRFEPMLALQSGTSGMNALRQITRTASTFLDHHGWLLLEHGYQQRELVSCELRAAGFSNIHCTNDLNGSPRVIEGERPGQRLTQELSAG